VALSPNLRLVRVAGSYVDAQGAPAAGSVTFTINAVLVDRALDQIILNSPVTVNLVNGAFAIDLPATNDPDLIPNIDVWYTVTERVGAASRPSFRLVLPYTTAVGGINLADVDIVAGAPSPIGTLAAFVRTVNGVGPDAAGNVAVSGGGTGTGTVTAASIIDATSIGRDLIAASVDAPTARAIIGAGTSSLALGTTAGTAAAGNHGHVAATITDLVETIQDRLAFDLVGGTGIALSYDDAGTGRVTITATGGGTGGGATDPEIVRDVIGGALIAGQGVQVTVNDVGDAITITAVDATTTTRGVVQYGTTAGTAAQGNHGHTSTAITDFTEAFQDRLGSDLVAGAGVTLTYDDAGTGRVTVSATGGGTGGTTDPEIVRDVIGAALIAGGGVQITLNDAADLITIGAVGATTLARGAIRLAGDLSGTADAPTVPGVVRSINGTAPDSTGALIITASGITTGTPGSGGTGQTPTIPAPPDDPAEGGEGTPVDAAPVDSGTPGVVEPPPTPPSATRLRTIPVSTVAALRAALADLTMRDRIEITGALTASDTSPGVITRTNSSNQPYNAPARFVINTPKGLSGLTPAQAKAQMPMVVGMGARGSAALVNGSGTGSGYTLFLDRAHYVWIENLEMRSGEKGFMAHNTEYSIAWKCNVRDTGHENWHWRNRSRYNLAYDCLADGAGATNAGTGEGFYIGMSEGSRNASYSMVGVSELDDSNGNRLVKCTARNTTAESVDVKEMTTNTYIGYCRFEGQRIAGAAANNADSYVDIKGNKVLMEECEGVLPSVNVLHGAETHILLAGYGNDITFRRNRLTAGAKATSLGIWIQTSGSRGTATGHVVYSDNVASAAPAGLTNIPVTGGGAVISDGGGTAAEEPRAWLYPLWRLHTPLPNAAGTSLLEIHHPELATYTSQWFSSTGEYLEFYQRADAYASSGSSYGRSELRETTRTGANAAWPSMVGYHALSVRLAVIALSANKPRVILTQIHNGDDVVTTRLDQKIPGNLTSGYVIRFMFGDGTDPAQPSVIIDGNYVLGRQLLIQMVVTGGKVYCYLNGVHRATFTDTVNNGRNYFKTGAYMLTRTGLNIYDGVAISPEPATSHVRVRIYGLSVEHLAAAPVVVAPVDPDPAAEPIDTGGVIVRPGDGDGVTPGDGAGAVDYFPEVVRIQQIQDVASVPSGALVLLKRRGQ
jgi:hypothetical protein